MTTEPVHVEDPRWASEEEPAGSRGILRKAPWVPLLLLVPLVVFGVFGSALAPHSGVGFNPGRALEPPVLFGGAWEHPLGTDQAGRDILSRIIIGARASLIVSFVGVFLAGVVGILVGFVAGYVRGFVDEAIMRVVDMQLAVPPILLVLLLAAVLGGGLTTIVVVVAVAFWPTYARIVRGETLGIMQRDHVLLARAAGCSRSRIMLRHVLPHLLSTVVVIGTLQLGAAVGLEAALSFLGVGIQPPDMAWGLDIAGGRQYMELAWWIPTFPGIAIAVTVLGANLLGDRLRDLLDPRMRNV